MSNQQRIYIFKDDIDDLIQRLDLGEGKEVKVYFYPPTAWIKDMDKYVIESKLTAAESQITEKDARIQELEQQLAERDAEIARLKEFQSDQQLRVECAVTKANEQTIQVVKLEQKVAERDAEIEKNGKFQDFLADEVKRLKTDNATLEQQLKDHRESLRKSVNRSADLSEQLKKAESVMNQIKIEFNSGRNPHEIWTLDLIEQYLKSRGE